MIALIHQSSGFVFPLDAAGHLLTLILNIYIYIYIQSNMGSHEIVFLIYQFVCLHLSLEATGYKNLYDQPNI